ncbi:MAG: ABC transporter permease subunit [Oscillospiraceae bacterium]|nr:ABC transporter permease subunit [Oscillospiraceae bacterium]
MPAVFWLAVWWLLALIVGKELLIPSPPLVVRTLLELVVTGAFWRYTALTLLRITLGLLLGIVLGILTALLTNRFSWLHALLAPAVRVVRATPVASFIILVLLWVANGRVPVVISALVVLPVIWESTAAGLRSVDRDLLEFARAYRLTRLDTWRRIVIPSMLPQLAAAVCTAIGLAWKSGVAAEVLCLPKAAVGTQVYFSKLYLDTPALFAWTLIVVALSLTVERIARRLLLGRKEDGK